MAAKNTTAEIKPYAMIEDFWDLDFFDQPDEPGKPVNITEKDNKFKIEIAAPGFQRSDFNIVIEDQLIQIMGEHHNKEDKEYLRKEFSDASFYGAFSLPDNINAEEVKASYEKGILTIKLKKSGNFIAKKKKVKIN